MVRWRVGILLNVALTGIARAPIAIATGRWVELATNIATNLRAAHLAGALRPRTAGWAVEVRLPRGSLTVAPLRHRRTHLAGPVLRAACAEVTAKFTRTEVVAS